MLVMRLVGIVILGQLILGVCSPGNLDGIVYMCIVLL